MPEDYGSNLDSWEAALSDYERCKSYILDFRHYKMSKAEPDRQVRTHSCFSYCRNGEDPNFLGDDRPECIDVEPELRDQLICLYPEDRCETTSVTNPWVISTITVEGENGEKVEEKLLFAFEIGIIAMILANPCQIIWDLMCAHLNEWNIDKDNAKQGCLLLTYQLILSLLFTFIFFYTIHLAIIVASTGDSFLVFITFVFTWLID